MIDDEYISKIRNTLDELVYENKFVEISKIRSKLIAS